MSGTRECTLRQADTEGTPIDAADITVEPLDESIVRVRVTGRLTAGAAMGQLELLAREYPRHRRLWDFRAADLSAFTPDQLRGLAETSQDDGGPSHAAALVARDLDFGIARMFEALSGVEGRPRYAVFRDEAESLDWLREA